MWKASRGEGFPCRAIFSWARWDGGQIGPESSSGDNGEGGEDGGRGDDEDEYQIYIYDSLEYHFYRAEAYHQFHPNVVLRRAVPASYTGTLKTVQAQLGRIDPTGCPEGGMPGF